MKTQKTLIAYVLLSACFFLPRQLSAQTKYLYGTCSDGGAGHSGTILVADDTGGNFHVAYAFQNATGADPVGRMVQAQDGKLYGCTFLGGYDDSCCLFSYDPMSGTYNMLYQFYLDISEGGLPWCGPTLSPSGMLYGLTTSGGGNGTGVIYSFDPRTLVYTDMYNFDSSSGGCNAELLMATDGKLYGLTSAGGQSGNGTIFRFDPATNNYSTLYSFDSIFHSGNAGLMQAADGKLYGTASKISSSQGLIFSLDPNTLLFSDVYHFPFLYEVPQTGLVQGSDGNLYGALSNFNADTNVIYSYNINNGVFNQLATLYGVMGYNIPRALTFSGNKLFGEATYGGPSTRGTFFSVDINTHNIEALTYLEADTMGYQPNGQIVEVTLCSPVMSHLSATICSGSSYQFGGQAYNSSGVYYKYVPLLTGCDSGVQLTLTVNTTPEVNLLLPEAPLCVGQNLLLYGGSPAGGVYSGSGVSGNQFTASSAGTYTVTYTYTDANSCTASNQATLIAETCTGIDGVSEPQLSIYPNPSNGSWFLTVDNSLIGGEAEVFDAEGRLVFKSEILNPKFEISFNAVSGVYVLRVSSAGNSMLRKLVRM